MKILTTESSTTNTFEFRDPVTNITWTHEFPAEKTPITDEFKAWIVENKPTPIISVFPELTAEEQAMFDFEVHPDTFKEYILPHIPDENDQFDW